MQNKFGEMVLLEYAISPFTLSGWYVIWLVGRKANQVTFSKVEIHRDNITEHLLLTMINVAFHTRFI